MNLSRKIPALTSHRLAVPLALLLVTGLAYGLSFWRLGFYWDDQPISWIRYQLGTQAITKYFADSRPVWALLYQVTGYLLPLQPAYWQLFCMFWRAAGSIALWLTMERLFPQRRSAAFLVSLLVLLYPGFNQQWVSYLYSHFFIVLFCLFFSWYLMLRGKTIPSMVLSAVNLLMLEYFFTLELLRPLLIYRSLEGQAASRGERIAKTVRLWLPYAGVIVLAVLYRELVYTHPGFGYSLTSELMRAPAATLTGLLSRVVGQLAQAAVQAWALAFQLPDPAVNGLRAIGLYAVVIALVGVILLLFQRLDGQASTPERKSGAAWLLSAGALGLLLGGVPFWLSNVVVSLSFPANRAMLSFMPGAALLLAGVLELLPGRIRYTLAAVLIALSAGRQFLWSLDYVRDWQAQKNLFWQMTWRAPGIVPGTLLLLNEGPIQFSSDNSLIAPLNWIYDPGNRDSAIDYVLFYPTSRSAGTLPQLAPGVPVRYDFIVEKFAGTTSQTLAFDFSPPGCLRLLDADIDADNRLIPDDSMMREAAVLSSSRWILAQPDALMPAIYGPEPAHGWCYYFEKASLAAQSGDWPRVAQLGDEALHIDDYPNDPVERFVFIEGYARLGRWNDARDLAIQSYEVSPRYVGPLLCKLLDRMDRGIPAVDDAATRLNELTTKFGCLP